VKSWKQIFLPFYGIKCSFESAFYQPLKASFFVDCSSGKTPPHRVDRKKAYFEIECFLTLSNWVGFSLRDGVWTFYEYTSDESIEKVKAFLETKRWNELTDMYKLGIHDYHSEKYLDSYDYPEEWIEESEIIDNWIFENEISIYRFLKELVLENEACFLL